MKMPSLWTRSTFYSTAGNVSAENHSALHRKAEQGHEQDNATDTASILRLSRGVLLMAHCQEYISTVNVLVSAFDSGVLADKGEYEGL